MSLVLQKPIHLSLPYVVVGTLGIHTIVVAIIKIPYSCYDSFLGLLKEKKKNVHFLFLWLMRVLHIAVDLHFTVLSCCFTLTIKYLFLLVSCLAVVQRWR